MALGAVAGILIGVLGNTSKAVAYTNISRNYRVCLLTTTNGSKDDARVWQTIQNAAKNAPINAQHITAPDGSAEQLQPYVNSLVAMKCQLIITPGEKLAGPATTAARSATQTRFLITAEHPDLPNESSIPTDSQALAADITNSAHGAGSTTATNGK